MGKIIGNTTATSNPRPDWNQMDETKADYIKNKPNFSNALTRHKSGASVSADDVSPVEHELDIKVNSKNLFDISKVKSSSSENSYVKNNGDGTLFVCTSTLTVLSAPTPNTLHDYAPFLKAGETYTLSAVTTGKKYIYISNTKTTWHFDTPLTITEDMLNSPVYWYAQHKMSDEVVTIKDIQIEEGTTATAYVPYIDVEGVTVKRCGKNLTSVESVNLTGATMSAVIYKGYLPKNFVLSWKQDFLATTSSQSALLSVKNLETNETVYGVASWETYDWVTKFSHGDGEVEITIINWRQFTGKLTQVQLEIGTTATEYEPYIEPDEVVVGENGNVKGLMSLAPNMTLVTDKDGVIIDCAYNRDINKAFEEITQALASLSANI
jgi:hypothetical protein